MVLVTGIIAGILFIASIGVIIWVLYIYFGGDRDVFDSDDIVLNWNSTKSNKRFLGSFSHQEDSLEGRELIYYRPKGIDIRPNKYSKKEIAEKIKEVKAICEPKKHQIIPKGALENDKAIHIILPRKAQDIPESVTKTIIGRAIMWATEEANMEKTLVDMLEEGKIRRADLLKMIGDGELSREWTQNLEERAKDSLKSLVTEKDKREKTTSIYNPPGTGAHNEYRD